MKHLYDKKRLIYHKQTSLEHILQNILNIEYFTCDWRIYLWLCIYD